MPEVNQFVLMRDRYDSDKAFSAALAEMILTLTNNDQEVLVRMEEVGYVIIEYLPRNFMYGGPSFKAVEVEEYEDLCAKRRESESEKENLPF